MTDNSFLYFSFIAAFLAKLALISPHPPPQWVFSTVSLTAAETGLINTSSNHHGALHRLLSGKTETKAGQLCWRADWGMLPANLEHRWASDSIACGNEVL